MLPSVLLLLVPAAFATALPSSPTLTPASTPVETKGLLTWRWTVDAGGFDLGDEVQLEDPILHGMTWAFWGALSIHPEECTPGGEGIKPSVGLVRAQVWRDGTVLTDTQLSVERSNCNTTTDTCDFDIHKEAVTTVYINSGSPLIEGDEIGILLGDAGGCPQQCEDESLADCSSCADCGAEVPARAIPRLPFKSTVCRDGDCVDLDTVTLETTPLHDASVVRLLLPSQALVGEPFSAKVVLLDEEGNVLNSGPNRVKLDVEAAGLTPIDNPRFVLSSGAPAWQDVQMQADSAGVYRVSAQVDGMESVRSNPIRVTDEEPDWSIYWGDIHVHHGQTWTDDAGDTHELDVDYARDVAGLDVFSESVKARGLELEEDDAWDAAVESCSRDTVEGSFIVFLGFEWMGRLASVMLGTDDEGHHNVYYDSCEGRYGTHAPEFIDSVDGDMGLWDWLRALKEATGVQAVTIPHAMRFTGYSYDVTDRLLQPLAEVYSVWGDNTTWTDLDRGGTIPDMIGRGARVGFIAASDNHDGFAGNPMVTYKGNQGGLAAWLAPALSRQDIFDAMRARRTYATTGIRPLISFWITDGDATIMPGAEYIADQPTLHWEYHAQTNIVGLRVVGVEVRENAPERALVVEDPDDRDTTGELVLDLDTSNGQAVWLEVSELGQMKAWSSPIFLSSDCARLTDGAEDPLGLCMDAVSDSGSLDTGSTDAGSTDAGSTDAGSTDAGSGTDPVSKDGHGCRSGSAAASLLWLPLLWLPMRRRTGAQAHTSNRPSSGYRRSPAAYMATRNPRCPPTPSSRPTLRCP